MRPAKVLGQTNDQTNDQALPEQPPGTGIGDQLAAARAEPDEQPYALRLIATFLHEAITMDYGTTLTTLFSHNPEAGLYVLSFCKREDEEAPADCPVFFGDVDDAMALLGEEGDDAAGSFLGDVYFVREDGMLCAQHLEDFVTLLRQISVSQKHFWDSRDFSFYDKNNPVPANDAALNGETAEMSDLILDTYPDILGEMNAGPPYTGRAEMQRDTLRAYNLAANGLGGYLTYTLDDLDRAIHAHHARTHNFSDPHKPGLWLH